MAEIKSTLDLVMQRTQSMTFNESEKKEQALKEAGQAAKGIVQKYLDKLIKREQAFKNWNSAADTHNQAGNQIIIDEILNRITLQETHDDLINLLTDFCERDPGPLKSVISEFNAASVKASQMRLTTLTTELDVKHNIYGSAVVPNLENDSAWQKNAEAILDRYREKLDLEKDRLRSELS